MPGQDEASGDHPCLRYLQLPARRADFRPGEVTAKTARQACFIEAATLRRLLAELSDEASEAPVWSMATADTDVRYTFQTVMTGLAPTASAPRNPLAIEPTLSLALAMHASRGAYALLLGSGVSRAAGVPAGWDIVLDLTRRVARLEQADPEPDPAAWYRERFGEQADYAILLARLAPTPAERRNLLRSYFEPTEEEREQGLKTPTRAHRAIARLAATGHVRVVLTTNFDHLLETALRDEGMAPAVVSTPDAVKGMVPLHLAPITIIKLHGDYLDTRIKNTPVELSKYPRPLDRLLDRVLDEYGLVVSGWSAAWDDALRRAIERCPTRRFTTFWTTVGPLGAEAERLVEHRAATVATVAGADALFGSLAEKVASLDELTRPHPTSTAVAVATLKRYLPRSEDRIRLADLVMDEVEEVRQRTIETVPLDSPTNENIVATVTRLTATSETLMALAAAGGQWWEARHARLWCQALERLGSPLRLGAAGESPSGIWSQIRRYPAQLAFYAAGVAAAASGHDGAVASLLLESKIDVPTERRAVAAYALNWEKVLTGNAKLIPGYEARAMAASDHLFAVLRPTLARVIADETAYAAAFERFELLAALGYMHERRARPMGNVWFPAGRAWYRRHHTYGSADHAIGLLGVEIKRAGKDWFLLRHGLFDGSLEKLEAMYADLVEQTNRDIG